MRGSYNSKKTKKSGVNGSSTTRMRGSYNGNSVYFTWYLVVVPQE